MPADTRWQDSSASSTGYQAQNSDYVQYFKKKQFKQEIEEGYYSSAPSGSSDKIPAYVGYKWKSQRPADAGRTQDEYQESPMYQWDREDADKRFKELGTYRAPSSAYDPARQYDLYASRGVS